MLIPEERVPYACRACRDIRLVLGGHKEIPCPACSSLTPDQREQRLRADTAQRLPKPEITLLDLTPDEFETYRDLMARFPSAHKLTVLGWVEGRRYHPAEDPEFLELVERRLQAWRIACMDWESIEPEWVRRWRAGERVDGYDRELALLEQRERQREAA